MRQHDRRQLQYYESRAETFYAAQGRDNRNHRKKIRALLQSLVPRSGQMLLEVAVGTGIHAESVLKRADVRLVALDLSLAMLQAARKRLGSRAGAVAANAAELPFADSIFDGVYGNGFLHHVGQPAVVISEMARVLKPGGRLAITEPNRIFPTNVWYWLTRPEERGMSQMAPAKLAKWATQADLAEVTCRPLPLYTPPFPVGLHGVFDSVDRLVGRTPLLRDWSIMLLLTATKPATETGDGSS